MDQDYRKLHYVEIRPDGEKATIKYDVPARALKNYHKAIQDLTQAGKTGLVALRSESHSVLKVECVTKHTPKAAVRGSLEPRYQRRFKI